MNCQPYQFLAVDGLPLILSTFLNPWHSELTFELLNYDGDVLNLAVECQSSSPPDFVVSAVLGDVIRGFEPCLSNNSNISVSLPLSHLPLTLNVDIAGNRQVEYLTLFSIYVQNCSFAQESSPWWVYLVAGFFCFLAIAALFILCYKERAYNRIERANQRLEIHDSSY